MPGETILTAEALFSAHGVFKIEWVALLGFFAAVAGDNVGYAIGVYAGRPAVVKYGRFVFLSSERLRKIELFFARHGGKVVVVARFFAGLRQFNGVVAGLSRMEWKRFLTFNAIGAALWAGVWISAAYCLSGQLGAILGWFEHFKKFVWIGLGLAGFILVVYVLIAKFAIGRRKD